MGKLKSHEYPPHRRQGFTLIELATVAAILGILAAIAVPNFLNANVRAKVAKAQADQEVIAWALESYFIDNEAYPPNRIGGQSGPDDLLPIIEPVPYLSQLPVDAFLAPANMERREYIANQRGGNPYYYYVNFLQATGKRMQLSSYDFTPIPPPEKEASDEVNEATPEVGGEVGDASTVGGYGTMGMGGYGGMGMGMMGGPGFGMNAGPKYRMRRNGSTNFVVYGLGPAYTSGQDPLQPETFIVYDPSNGTTSVGTIQTFGP